MISLTPPKCSYLRNMLSFISLLRGTTAVAPPHFISFLKIQHILFQLNPGFYKFWPWGDYLGFVNSHVEWLTHIDKKVIFYCPDPSRRTGASIISLWRLPDIPWNAQEISCPNGSSNWGKRRCEIIQRENVTIIVQELKATDQCPGSEPGRGVIDWSGSALQYRFHIPH